MYQIKPLKKSKYFLSNNWIQRAAGGGSAASAAERNGLLRASRTYSMQAGEKTPLQNQAYEVCAKRI